MPIYEYQCTDCEHRLEALQKISDPLLIECPVCHHQSLKKLISAASFRLKGGGWYETDFKKDGRKQLATSDTEPTSKEDKSGHKTGDEKSAQKSASQSSSGKDRSGSEGSADKSKSTPTPTASKSTDSGNSKGG